MDPQTIIQIITEWKLVVVSLLVMVLLPVVFYVASMDKNKFNGGMESHKNDSKIVKSESTPPSKGKQTATGEVETVNEKDNNQGSEGA